MRILLLALLLITTNAFAENTKPKPNMTCTKDGCWSTYLPKNAVKKDDGRVSKEAIILLNTDDVLQKNITVTQLTKLIEFIDKSLNTNVNNSQVNGHIRLHVAIYPDNFPTYQLGYHGNIDKEFLNTFYNQLNNNHYDLQTKTDTISFLILYTINKK